MADDFRAGDAGLRLPERSATARTDGDGFVFEDGFFHKSDAEATSAAEGEFIHQMAFDQTAFDEGSFSCEGRQTGVERMREILAGI